MLHAVMHSYLLYLTACFYAVLALITFTRKRTPITMFFGTMLVLSGIWAATYTAELDATHLAEKIRWMKFRLIFTPLMGASSLAFALAITGMLKSFNRWLWVVVLLFPYITMLLAFTNWHPEWFRYDFEISTFHGIQVLSYSSGFWDTIHELTFHGTSLMGFFILLSAWHSSSPLLQKQIIFIAIAYLIPTLGNLVHTYNLLPELGINPAPFFLLPTTILLSYVVFRYRVLDLVPIARSMILDYMNDGLIVLDSFGLLVDINSVAEKWIGVTGIQVLGSIPTQLPSPWNVFLPESMQEENTYKLETADADRWFTCKAIPILDAHTEVKGTLILIRDTTVENLHRILRDQNRQRNSEIQQLNMQKLITRDIHDGLGGLAANMALMAALALKEENLGKKNEWLGKLQQLAGETNVEIRELMNSLECSTLGWPDVIDAIRRVSRVMFDDRITEAHVRIDGVPPTQEPGMTAGMSIIRMAKECMNNIVKHAQANQVEICMTFSAQHFLLTVQDNGQGFDPRIVRHGRGLGNLSKRVGELSGTIEFTQSNGTLIQVSIPLPIKDAIKEQEEEPLT